MLAEGARDFHPYLSSTPTFDFQFECRRMSSRMVSREPEPCPMRECGRVDVRLGGCVGKGPFPRRSSQAETFGTGDFGRWMGRLRVKNGGDRWRSVGGNRWKRSLPGRSP